MKTSLGQRIMVIGSGGAGKSVLSRQLGEVLGLPVIHLDAEHWRPGWELPPKEEWRRKVAELASRGRWIMDGNYSADLSIRLAAADTVVFLDYPRCVCLWRVLVRVCRHHGETRPDMAPGCPEHLDLSFLRWVYDFPRHSRSKIVEALGQRPETTRVIIHRSPRETRAFLAELSGGQGDLPA